jgi:hypothetical protein
MRCKTIVVLIYPHGDPQKHTYKSYPNIIELLESPCQFFVLVHNVPLNSFPNIIELPGDPWQLS